jgi:hypothetical protein
VARPPTAASAQKINQRPVGTAGQLPQRNYRRLISPRNEISKIMSFAERNTESELATALFFHHMRRVYLS